MEKDIFQQFSEDWALVSAGTPEKFGGCTVAWGSLGSLWRKKVLTVYIHPDRYTCQFLRDNDYFTVSFFSEQYRQALGYMGSHSGHSEDKAKNAGLTAVKIGAGVTYAQAEKTFLCRKLYQHPFSKEDLAPEIRDYYCGNPKSFPPDENGDWQTHWQFIGEVVEER